MNDELIEIDAEIVHRTDRAVLAHTGNKEEAAWLPLSLIEVGAAGLEGLHVITLPEWLAIDRGLV